MPARDFVAAQRRIRARMTKKLRGDVFSSH
jgi:hypothetical protein